MIDISCTIYARFLWILIGISIGIMIEWTFWIFKCYKKGLFDKEGHLRSF
jgi:hypothetical protein